MVKSQLQLNQSTQLFILCHFQLASLKLQLFVVFFFFFNVMLRYIYFTFCCFISSSPWVNTVLQSAHSFGRLSLSSSPRSCLPTPTIPSHCSRFIHFPVFPNVFFCCCCCSGVQCLCISPVQDISNSRSLFTVDPSFLCGCKQQYLGSSYYYWVNFLVLCTWFGNSHFFCLLKPLFILSMQVACQRLVG